MSTHWLVFSKDFQFANQDVLDSFDSESFAKEIKKAAAQRLNLGIVSKHVRQIPARVDELEAKILFDPLCGFVSTASNIGLISPFYKSELEGSLNVKVSLAHSRYVMLPVCDPNFLIINWRVCAALADVVWISNTLELFLFELMFYANRIGFSAWVDVSRQFYLDGGCTNGELAINALKQKFQEIEKLFVLKPLQDACHLAGMLEELWRFEADGVLSVILDCRGLGAVFNGTSELMVNVLRELSEDEKIDCHIICERAAFSFHGLERIKLTPHFDELPRRYYNVFYKPNQVWGNHEIQQMRHYALRMGCLFLDSIAWDCLYLRGDPNNQFYYTLPSQLDFITFISDYGKQLFVNRFSKNSRCEYIVTRLSLSMQDYCLPTKRVADSSERETIVIFGNHYAHKMLNECLDFLVKQKINENYQLIVFGKELSGSNILGFASGQISEEKLSEIIQSAAMLIYPSNYEGFGFPFVRGLVNRIPTFARDNLLNRELLLELGIPEYECLYNNWDELIQFVNKRPAVPECKSTWNWKSFARKLKDCLFAQARRVDHFDSFFERSYRG